MVTVVLANDRLTTQLPQACVVVGAGRHQVSRVGAKGTVPYPALVAMKGRLEREGIDVTIGSWKTILTCNVMGRGGIDGPDPSGMVGRAGGEVADVWREQYTIDVLVVS